MNHSNLLSYRQGSPSSLLNGAGHYDRPPSYDELLSLNDTLKTRVSELEVINDLFKGRVAELENTEAEKHRKLEEVLAREADLRQRLEAMEREHGGQENAKQETALEEATAQETVKPEIALPVAEAGVVDDAEDAHKDKRARLSEPDANVDVES